MYNKLLLQITATIFPLKVQRSGEFIKTRVYIFFSILTSLSLARKGREHINAQQRTISTTICEIRKRVTQPAVDPLRFTRTRVALSYHARYHSALFNFAAQSTINCLEFVRTWSQRDRKRVFIFVISQTLLQTLYAINHVIPVARSITCTPSNGRFVQKIVGNDPVKRTGHGHSVRQWFWLDVWNRTENTNTMGDFQWRHIRN